MTRNIKLYKRGIHDESLLKDLMEGGSLYPLISLVREKKNDLVLQIRDNYLNLYYQGGNVAEIHSADSVILDKNYFRTHAKKENEDWAKVNENYQEAVSLYKSGCYEEYIKVVTDAMNNYDTITGKGTEEKRTQHRICIDNMSNSDYTIVDLEYQVSSNSVFSYRGNRKTKKGTKAPSPRFDIIAIRNRDHRLCVIELKKGTKALKDPSGIQEHAESYRFTIGYDSTTEQAFVDEMNMVLKQKRDLLGLIDKSVFIDTTLPPEFLYAYQYNPNEKSYLSFEAQKSCFAQYQNSKDRENYAKDKRVIWLDDNVYKLKDAMTITIHRGIDQIGGCITEIASSNGTKILIDLGHNLPEGDSLADDKYDDPKELETLLNGVSHIFYSHYHGDHIGFESKVPITVEQHIGALSLKMMITLKEYMKFADDLKEEACESLEALSRFKVYEPKVKVDYGGIKVTPYPISHSAVDAYMFVIECDGKRILHTGDFRDHGYGAKERLRDVENEVGNIDILITEGTLLSRDDKRMMSEKELQDEAYKWFNKYKYAFVLCSSMDADRIVSFFMASQHCNKDRRFIADSYQIEQIKNLKQLPDPYNQLFAYPYGRDQESEWRRMKQCGFTMLVRNTVSFRKRIHETMKALHLNPKEVLFIYSMFDGYVNPLRTKIFKKELYDFTHLYNWDYIPLHTSGHASKEALQAICEHINPKKAIIPIHKEELGLLGKLDMDIHCPIVESTQVVDGINIIIK